MIQHCEQIERVLKANSSVVFETTGPNLTAEQKQQAEMFLHRFVCHSPQWWETSEKYFPMAISFLAISLWQQ